MEPRNLPEDTHVIFQPTLVHWNMRLYFKFQVCTQRWHVPSQNHEPSWEKLRFARSLHWSLSQFVKKNYRSMLVPCHETMPSFMIFRRVLELQDLKNQVVNLSGRATTPRCLNSLPSLAWDLEIHPRTHMWFLKQLWCTGARACSLNLNYSH